MSHPNVSPSQLIKSDWFVLYLLFVQASRSPSLRSASSALPPPSACSTPGPLLLTAPRYIHLCLFLVHNSVCASNNLENPPPTNHSTPRSRCRTSPRRCALNSASTCCKSSAPRTACTLTFTCPPALLLPRLRCPWYVLQLVCCFFFSALFVSPLWRCSHFLLQSVVHWSLAQMFWIYGGGYVF